MVSAAAVVHVFALLELRCHCEIVMRASQHAPERNVMLAVLALVVFVDHGLDGFAYSSNNPNLWKDCRS